MGRLMSKQRHISYKATGSFSKLVLDYLEQNERLKPFITDFPSVESIKRQIELRKSKVVNREALVEVLKEQYRNNGIELNDTKVGESIAQLRDERTFTICAAHQPNIFTGYLYTLYKIVHAINLARECAEQIPGYNFIPVFFIGSEDNDIDEIGAFNFKDKGYQWKPDDTGACGRISTQSLIEIRDEIISNFGHSDEEKIIKNQLITSYNGSKTLTQATQHFINTLFGEYGLISLDADERRLKMAFTPIIKDELVEQNAQKLVIEHNIKLSEHYKVQVEPRALNLFYLKGKIRERIEQSDSGWTVVNTDIKFSDIGLVEEHPEYFSPNVILRPLYQETILPNVAFVGGGSEIAYWCELKTLFEHYNLPFPILFVRNSISLISEKVFKKMDKIGFEESFKPLENALKEKSLTDPVYIQLLADFENLNSKYEQVLKSAAEVSPNLDVSSKAHWAKIKKNQDRIKTKYRAHLKRKYDDLMNHKLEILAALFPDGKMQERHENYIELVCRHKHDIVPYLLGAQKGFGLDYLVMSL